jgi:hypothetical protein
LLNRVMQKAIGRLPVAVQPVARKLAERLGLAPKAAPAPSAPDTAAPADVTRQVPTSEPSSRAGDCSSGHPG